MLSKARKWASISVGIFFGGGNMDGRFFLGGFLIRGILLVFLELCKMLPRRVPISLGAPLGNLEGVRLLGLLREKK